MAFLPETDDWAEGIYQFELTDPVQGGADGVDNVPTKQLANRTVYLRGRLEALQTQVAALPSSYVTSVAGKTGSVSLVKADVGLGNVENYAVASQSEAEAGTSNARFMTPLRVAQAISQMAPAAPVTSVAGKTGAVTLAKADVGLGNVENYAVATQAQAEAGTANNLFMTPLRVVQAFAALVLSSLKTVNGQSILGSGDVTQPQVTGSCTTNGDTNNTLQLPGIVAALGLEVGDVIQVSGSTGGANDKLFTVESIADGNNITVNYEHAGNRGNGPLRLANQTATVTVKRIAKWFNAPQGLGQAWVNVSSFRPTSTTFTNTTNRLIGIDVAINVTSASGNRGYQFFLNGSARGDDIFGAGSNGGNDWIIQVPIPHQSTYSYERGTNTSPAVFWELR